MQGLFITGSDTGVGKTVITCALASRLSDQGHKVATRKPVESGCDKQADKLYPKDAAALKTAAKSMESLEVICPYRFEPAVAPAHALRNAGLDLKLEDLTKACKARDNEFALIEGAGGWLSPLSANITNADLAAALKLPIVLVVSHKLGCINQTMLTVESIMARNLTISKIYLNQAGPEEVNIQDYEYLQSILKAKVIKVPFFAGPESYKQIKQLDYFL